MNLEDAHHHADRVLELVRAGVHDRRDDVVAQSWIRCFNEYRLHPAKVRLPTVVSRAELDERRERNADIISCASFEMTSLFQQLADPEAAGRADRYAWRHPAHGGRTRVRRRDRAPGPAAGRYLERSRGRHQWPGHLPGRRAAGGRAPRRSLLHTASLSPLTCSAVPVYDPSGEIAAVLDVSSRSSLMQQQPARAARHDRTDDREPPDRRALRQRLARCTSTADPNSSTRCTKASWPSARTAASSRANRSALFQLGLQSASEIRSQKIEDLFPDIARGHAPA